MVNSFDYNHLAVSITHESTKDKPQEVKKNVKLKRKRAKCDSPEKLKYFCKFCGEFFKKQDSLNRHMFKHTGKKPFICDYEGCSKQYTNKSHLKRHKKSCHEAKPEIGSFSCDHPGCPQQFTIKSNMKRHFETHHLNPLPQACTQCSERFRRKLQLKKHVIQKHSGAYPHVCPECNQGFLNTFTLSRHQTTHKVNNKQHSCSDCQATFDKWSLLVEHRRRLHKNEPRFTCDLCAKTFCRKPNLKDHMKLHQTEGEVFQCHYENCPKFYTVKRNLTAHIRSKHEGKRWICFLCCQEKSTKQKLAQHIRAHLDPSKKLVTQTSTVSKLAGVSLPLSLEQMILKGAGALVELDLPPPPENDTETSDF